MPQRVITYFGKRLRALRRERDMTLRDLATKLHLSPQMLSFYERGEADPPHSRVEQFARFFGVDPGTFYPPPTDGEEPTPVA
jgi:transcriptional regulator with XRE-family HTH domain